MVAGLKKLVQPNDDTDTEDNEKVAAAFTAALKELLARVKAAPQAPPPGQAAAPGDAPEEAPAAAPAAGGVELPARVSPELDEDAKRKRDTLIEGYIGGLPEKGRAAKKQLFACFYEHHGIAGLRMPSVEPRTRA